MTQTKMRPRRVKVSLALMLMSVTALAGCRESEENRVIKLEKGVYAGQSDTKLTDEQRRELRARGLRQKI
jgi:ABC-type uncharacterized transport system auxiliary subunit